MTLNEHTTVGPHHLVAAEPELVAITTTRFGEVPVRAADRFLFPTGLPGFAGPRELYLFPNPGGGCFEWLHAGRGTPLGFAVLEPDGGLTQVIDPAVRTARRLLGWEAEDAVEVRLIVTIPNGAPEHATINLRAPVLLNRTRGLGAQPILTDETLPYRLPLFPDSPAPTAR
jgi:flagellar assembly factor FliW